MPPRYLFWPANHGREGFIQVLGWTCLGALLTVVILPANLLLAAVSACHFGGDEAGGLSGLLAGDCDAGF